MKYLGREIIEIKTFDVEDTFESMYAAQRWLSENGYECGSTSAPDKEVAIVKGEYDLPQKWKNFTPAEKKLVDGVMVANNRFREGLVTIYLF